MKAKRGSRSLLVSVSILHFVFYLRSKAQVLVGWNRLWELTQRQPSDSGLRLGSEFLFKDWCPPTGSCLGLKPRLVGELTHNQRQLPPRTSVRGRPRALWVKADG